MNDEEYGVRLLRPLDTDAPDGPSRINVAKAMGDGLRARRVRTWSTALAVTAGIGVLDLFRPEAQRSSVGRLLLHTQDGTAGYIARRIGEANVVTTVTSPLTLLVIGTVLYVTFVLQRDWGGFRRLLGVFPPVRGALAG